MKTIEVLWEQHLEAIDRDAALDARLDAVERCMKQYTKLEGSRLAAYEDLAERQDLLEQVAEGVWDIAGKGRNALAERVTELEEKVVLLKQGAAQTNHAWSRLIEHLTALEHPARPAWERDDADDVDVTEAHA